jgi:myosin heavy subunit
MGFIGVLDIAGFEIFKVGKKNGLANICIYWLDLLPF